LICIARSHASVAVRISTWQAAPLLRGHLSNVRYPNNDAALGRVMRQNRKGFKGHSCRACIASLRCRAARDSSVEHQLSNDSVSPMSKHTGSLLYNMINPGKPVAAVLYRTVFLRKPLDLSDECNIVASIYLDTRDKLLRFRAICLVFFPVIFKGHASL